MALDWVWRAPRQPHFLSKNLQPSDDKNVISAIYVLQYVFQVGIGFCKFPHGTLKEHTVDVICIFLGMAIT
jgi:hypothetical protein